MITGSQLARISACPASETFQHVGSTSPAAERGTQVHAYLERYARARNARVPDADARTIAMAGVPAEYRELCASIRIEDMELQFPLFAEISVAYDCATGAVRELGIGNRNYDVTDTEIPATLDAVMVRDGYCIVADYKTGTATRARDNLQIRFGCMVMAKMHGFGRAAGVILSIDVNTGRVTPDACDFSPDDLRDIEQQICDLYRSVRRAKDKGATPTEGAHCRFCPAWSACPAKRLALASLGDAREIEITNTNAVAVYARLRDVERQVRHVKQALAEYVEANGPLVVDDRTRYGVHQVERDEIDASVAYQVVETLAGRNAAIVAADISITSKAAIERALKGLDKPGLAAIGKSRADAMRAVMAKIADSGGIKKTQQTRTEEWWLP